MISLHTGNWEVGAAALQMLDLRWAGTHAPPAREVQRRIANKVRETFGMEVLPPGRASARPAIRHLQQGRCICIFCDEVHHDVVMAPFFGRPPHIDGNLAIAARLARMTGAKIVVVQLARIEGCHFTCAFHPAVTLVPGRATPEQLLRDVILLDGIIAPIVEANLDQWYFLDNNL
jgi:KDO2-lipid IV(A) lauroyltransferase